MFSFLQSLISTKNFGLHITDDWIKALQLEQNLNIPVIKAIEHQALPVGVVRGGEVLDQARLAQEITKFLSHTKPQSISTRKCAFALPSTQTYEHIFYLPSSLKGEALKEKLDQLVEESIPLPFHELKYDYHISTRDQLHIIFVVGTRRVIIAQYYEVLKNICNLNPTIAEPESLSLLRNIPLKFEKDNAFILIDIKEKNIPWFSFWGHDIFDSNILSKEEIQKNPQLLINDIENSIASFEDLTKRKINYISISGQQAEAEEMSRQLSEKIKVPINIIEKYKLVPKINDINYFDEFKIVAGLALKGLGFDNKTCINLFKK